MVNQEPLISVLMTAYNREKYIAEAIESVLNSTFQDFELIIVDDCSKDSTLEIAKGFEKKDSRVKVFSNKVNLGDYPNRNKAASYASGKYIKYLDSDDYIYPNSLDIMVSAMEKFQDSTFGLSAIGNLKSPYPIQLSPRESYFQHFNGYGHFNRAPGSAIMNRLKFEMEGGFKIPRYAGDAELWFRLAQKYDVVLFQMDLVWDRCHDESERINESKDKNASKIRHELVHKMLQSNNCPLDKKQVRQIIFKRRLAAVKSSIKGIVQFFLPRF